MASDKEPNVWLTVLKLALGAAALAGLVWAALWYLDNYGDGPPMTPRSRAAAKAGYKSGMTGPQAQGFCSLAKVLRNLATLGAATAMQ
jgi:hypothetical protein